MKVHEYQAKEILRRFGVPTPEGRMVTHPAAAYEAARALGGERWVVKAQIHAGGRGKGGGVKVVGSIDEVGTAAEQILGMTLVTPQTGPEGKLVNRLLIEKAVDIDKELYFSILVDRQNQTNTIMASAQGGMEIEEVAESNPEAIITVPVSATAGYSDYVARKLAFGLGLDKAVLRKFSAFVAKAYKAFVEMDGSLLEINPLVITKQGDVIALDAKVMFDDNSLRLHPELDTMRDFDEEEPLEILAGRYGVDYVKMDGGIGCLVNGAGLAMATMDIILRCGSRPANFLDIKGGANVQNVIKAFTLLMGDENVKTVLINIFGGIVKCDMVATGILEAMKSVKVDVPVVVRLSGTNSEEARKILNNADFPFITAETLIEAAEKAVEAEKGVAS
ncbi:MAG: ADP-forming succinate--CoA ligase subunit beta [Deltaproteobacteria bacterium]|nr:ADP-forming succinate--CoA ligase subunit beta [Deltaproteobacteria bacterium]MCB9478518.1 ADP-forming succinate--CoA ligase subunit beta [Deltaproteobacteria bacterium]